MQIFGILGQLEDMFIIRFKFCVLSLHFNKRYFCCVSVFTESFRCVPSNMQARHLCFIFTNILGPVEHFSRGLGHLGKDAVNVHVVYFPQKS